MDTSTEVPDNKEIISLIKNLEERISRLESSLNVEPLQQKEPEEKRQTEVVDFSDKEEELEYRIGQFWFAKVGIVVLIIGIAFFLTFPYNNLPPFLPGIFGYILTAVIFGFSSYFKKISAYMSGYLLGGGLALLYFTTLRLYFFGSELLITDLSLEIFLLVLIIFFNLFISIRKNSVYLTALSCTLGYATAIASDNSYFIFIMILFMSLLAVYFKTKYQWDGLIFYSLVLTYITHFIWSINNPFWGRNIQAVASPQINLIFILLYAVVFAFANLYRNRETHENFSVTLSSILNTFFCYGLFSIITMAMKPEYFAVYHLLASVLFSAISILFWIYKQSKYSTFIYAMFGYLALSVAIIIQFETPEFFIWLCWQSLLVVSTAVWFRSKIIILANFIIYIIIFIAYLALEGKADLVSLSYGIVALLSARILNWKKDRLELKTEQMRNAYLLTALFIIPYTLYFAMPEKLISVSWIAVAIIYYTFSLILKNKKYRWMSLLTLLLTVVYVFIIGVTSSDPTYKIISFVALGVVLIIFSLIYTKFRKSIKKIINP
ncbi:MAG: DUF2339 domain-containing protein [Ignavibacteriaceae bacterium]